VAISIAAGFAYETREVMPDGDVIAPMDSPAMYTRRSVEVVVVTDGATSVPDLVPATSIAAAPEIAITERFPVVQFVPDPHAYDVSDAPAVFR
jgi:hypothetical protein